MGFYISFSGIVTLLLNSCAMLRAMFADCLVEFDSPYLALGPASLKRIVPAMVQ